MLEQVRYLLAVWRLEIAVGYSDRSDFKQRLNRIRTVSHSHAHTGTIITGHEQRADRSSPGLVVPVVSAGRSLILSTSKDSLTDVKSTPRRSSDALGNSRTCDVLRLMLNYL